MLGISKTRIGSPFSSLLPFAAVTVAAMALVSADPDSIIGAMNPESGSKVEEPDVLLHTVDSLQLKWIRQSGAYQHVWPELKFGWAIVIGTLIGIFGAAFGSVGGVGGGGIFVPMLTLVIGFDPKSSTAISKCMIMGAAISTVIFNIRLRHPSLDMPIIDYDLVLLIQPMLMLGISIGVMFNVIFADWMVSVLIIILSVGTSIKAFLKGIETWKRESTLKQVANKSLEATSSSTQMEYKPLPGSPAGSISRKGEVSVIENIYWKELGLLTFVWAAYLILQLGMSHVTICSKEYWVWNALQIPVSIGVYLYEAISLYKGRRVIASKGSKGTNWRVHQLLLYCACAVLAGMIGGMLGIGGGFVMGPVFLELGIPPEVASATATFGMMFSSSMSVVEYYLLKRFPIPYAIYFITIATVAAFVGQHVVRKLIKLTGRASIIIFILSFTIFISAILLGGVGVSNMIPKIVHNEYMGFEDLCKYNV